MIFIPYALGVYIAFILENEDQIVKWMKKKAKAKETAKTTQILN